MNKLFTKIAALVLGMTMAVGVGVAVGTSGKETSSVEATSSMTYSFGTADKQTWTAGTRTYTTCDSNVGVSWTISNPSNVGNYNSGNYKGIQLGTGGKNGKAGSITLTSANDWGSQNSISTKGYTIITKVELFVNGGDNGVASWSGSIGGVAMTSSGTQVKNSSASSWSDASKITFTPAQNSNTGALSLTISKTGTKNVAAAYFCGFIVYCSQPEEETHTVSFDINTAGYGSVSPTSITNVPNNSDITVDGNEITINGTTVTATPTTSTDQYTYSFVDWTNTSGKVTADRTITANFERTTNSYDVTFDMQGHGASIDKQTIEYNGLVSKPTDPTADGFTFGGWYKESGCSTAWNFGSDKVTGTTILYAKWTANAKVYHVTANLLLNASLSSLSDVVEHVAVSLTISAAEHYTLPENITVTMGGNAFSNYTYTRAPGNRTASFSIAAGIVEGDLDFSGSAIEDSKYSVTYTASTHGDGSYTHDVQYYAGQVHELLDFEDLTGVSADSGYQFKDYTVGGQTKAPGDEITINDTTEVTVNFEVETHETTITTNIGTYATAHSWVNETQYSTIDMDTVISVEASGGGNTGKYYTNGNNWRLYQGENATLTFTASSGNKIKSITVTYSPNNDGVLLDANNNQISSGTKVSLNDVSSYTFSVGNSGSATNGQVRISEIEVVYESGSPVPTTYTVGYNANGGTGTMTDENSPYEAGSEVTVLENEFTRAGYSFDCWNTQADGEGTDYAPNAKFTINANTILYAQWTEVVVPGSWELTDLDDLTSNDIFVIVGDNGDATYAMPNNNGTSAPTVVSVTVEDDEITSTVTNSIKWTISGDATDGYIFYPYGTDETWLYATNTNNGVKVGTGDAKHFTLSEDGYLTTSETTDQRYIGIYNSQDWRCYTSTSTNIGGQSFAFYKFVAVTPVITIHTQTNDSYYVGEPIENFVTITDGDISGVTYTSTNPEVAVVEGGTLTVLSEGDTTITASYSGAETKTATIHAYNLIVSGAVDNANGNFYIEDSGTLVLKVPEGYNKFNGATNDGVAAFLAAGAGSTYDPTTKTVTCQFESLSTSAIQNLVVEFSFGIEGQMTEKVITKTLHIVNPLGLPDARLFATYMNAMCNGASTKDDWSIDVINSYAGLSTAAKNILKNARYSVTGTGDQTVVTKDGSTHKEIAQAMAQYDYMVLTYGFDDIIGRNPSSGKAVVDPISIFGTAENSQMVAIVVIVSLVSLTAIGGYFFLKKRREQN